MELSDKSQNAFKSYRISWVSYFWLIFRFCIVMGILVAIYYFGTKYSSTLFSQEDMVKHAQVYNIYSKTVFWLPIGLGVLFFIKFIIDFLYLRSMLLYIDESGVWLFRGIFPWSKGVIGVKWIDLEDAIYFPNFLSWILRTYDIRIGHRFTKTSEIIIKNVFNGKKAVLEINEYHRKYIANSNAYTINDG